MLCFFILRAKGPGTGFIDWHIGDFITISKANCQRNPSADHEVCPGSSLIIHLHEPCTAYSCRSFALLHKTDAHQNWYFLFDKSKAVKTAVLVPSQFIRCITQRTTATLITTAQNASFSSRPCLLAIIHNMQTICSLMIICGMIKRMISHFFASSLRHQRA